MKSRDRSRYVRNLLRRLREELRLFSSEGQKQLMVRHYRIIMENQKLNGRLTKTLALETKACSHYR